MSYIERKRWVFFALPFTFTKYTIEEEKITINQGCFSVTEDSIYMYKILDLKLERSLFERMFGLGTIVCYTGDITDKVLKIQHIKNSKLVNDFIFENSEKMRIKRRTINTQNLTGNMNDFQDADGDGIPDEM